MMGLIEIFDLSVWTEEYWDMWRVLFVDLVPFGCYWIVVLCLLMTAESIIHTDGAGFCICHSLSPHSKKIDSSKAAQFHPKSFFPP